jgi:hypothetical protein
VPAAIDELVGRVVRRLDDRGIATRLIGASALAAHGVARSTHDVDLLATEPAVLDPALWDGVTPPHFTLVIRRGDDTDPLLGVVRFEEDIEDDRDWDDPPAGLDVVLIRGVWAREMTRSPGPSTRFGDTDVRAVAVADLVLLKLYAGGPRDRWDIAALLQVDRPDQDAVLAEIDARVATLPGPSSRLWRRIRADAAGRP